MASPEILIESKEKSIKDLIKCANFACGDDISLLSHWARYICISSAGSIEICTRFIFDNYDNSTDTSGPYERWRRYGKGQLKFLSNPKHSKIIEVSRSFDPCWADIISDYFSNHKSANAIDSIMTNRHAIAHGQSSNVTISQMNEWVPDAFASLKFVSSIVKY